MSRAPSIRSTRRTWPYPLAAGALGMGGVAALWPGVATWDTLTQYRQAVSGRYDDWHPPVMARLWSGLMALGLGGSGPLLLLQWALLWGGLGLLAAALARAEARRAALAVIAAGLMPVQASWMACVLKDCQLLGALTAATGLVAWFRLDGRRMPGWAVRLVVALLVYAALLRANAVFSVVPLALAWADWRGRWRDGWLGLRRWWARAALLAAACLAVIAALGPIDHRLLGAEPSHVERTLPLFDMAGIAHRAHLASLPDLPASTWREAERRGCATPFFWDPFADPARCGPIGTALAFARDETLPSIEGEWLRLIAAHPFAYGAHRLAHLNATLRIAAPADERLATGPAASLANPDRVGEPARGAAAWLAPLASLMAATPAGVPAVWLVLAAGLWWTLAGTPSQPARALGLALVASATVQTASFAVVSIASDLRYHLWLMLATMLAAALTGACRDPPRDRVRITIAATLLAALGSAALRASVTGQLG